MTDRPILFSAPMVRALLAGTKTQTRRLLKPQPHLMSDKGLSYIGTDGKGHSPRIEAKDRLWVREAVIGEELMDGTDGVRYVTDDAFISIASTSVGAEQWLDLHHYGSPDGTTALQGRQVPSIHMPRWASRLTLIVTDVRVQRLQDITHEDARAEGVTWNGGPGTMKCPWGISGVPSLSGGFTAPERAYAALWDHINGPGSWDANPWVAAYSFTVEHRNIDQVAQ